MSDAIKYFTFSPFRARGTVMYVLSIEYVGRALLLYSISEYRL